MRFSRETFQQMFFMFIWCDFVDFKEKIRSIQLCLLDSNSNLGLGANLSSKETAENTENIFIRMLLELIELNLN